MKKQNNLVSLSDPSFLNSLRDLYTDTKSDLPVQLTSHGYFRLTEYVKIDLYRYKDEVYLYDASSFRDLEHIQIIIPKNFIMDGASVPWALRWLSPEMGKHSYGAMLHDFLYRCAGTLVWSDGVVLSQSHADQAFDRLNEAYKVKSWRVKVLSIGLRIGGFVQYGKMEKRNLANLQSNGKTYVGAGKAQFDLFPRIETAYAIVDQIHYEKGLVFIAPIGNENVTLSEPVAIGSLKESK